MEVIFLILGITFILSMLFALISRFFSYKPEIESDYWENEKLKCRTIYQNPSKKDFKKYTYLETGELDSIGSFENGKIRNMQLYYKTGGRKSEHIFRDGEMISVRSFKNTGGKGERVEGYWEK